MLLMLLGRILVLDNIVFCLNCCFLFFQFSIVVCFGAKWKGRERQDSCSNPSEKQAFSELKAVVPMNTFPCGK